MKSLIVKGPIRLHVYKDKLFASTVGIAFNAFSIFCLNIKYLYNLFNMEKSGYQN